MLFIVLLARATSACPSPTNKKFPTDNKIPPNNKIASFRLEKKLPKKLRIEIKNPPFLHYRTTFAK
ncbi:hypothetical protein AUK14_01515 [Candidatus Berkelbacteria bacterium CG2_30_39_44]|nr:MAG: hypothetical protein AUK14_01515 [Candidatus Berkelbacteria bacterium CG2_30_39_44]